MFQRCSFGFAQSLSCVNRRHAQSRIGGPNAIHNDLLIQISGTSFRIQAQFRFAVSLVWTMAGEAFIGQDGPNVAVELNGGSCAEGNGHPRN